MAMRLTEDEFADLVEEAISLLPDQFEEFLENVSVDIQPRPDRALVDDLALSDDQSLLGVYVGVPLTEKSVRQIVDWPPRIVIFQRNVEDACDSVAEVVEQVRKTILHEIGHHFGFDEDGLAELGYD